MGLDIRVPIGWMFVILGLVLAVFGCLSDPAIYQRSLDINVNLAWGLFLTASGALCLLLGRRG